ncbi:class I SAM-dependent methyltransferase [Singulisphaera acidiphila]|uniref:Methyltransferase family protein n=1 Tax=Singulisphaera acidiphila (strain ATCC BAA-1392 / DSM 18658 / VKM B-2454 / MOB10) TaxID=886293 RepID=L0D6Y1_SINAD|nr:class I SAM-dependent methyltransferase [Singulisphaera acidiphila]AGA24635.1 methyltransferase family protein [Singulisphaera acidiphila DSM 18658]
MTTSRTDPPLYDQIAAAYAAKVDTSPYNALYERPAMLALLPPVQGRDLLDAGCGSGWYSEQFIARGARVTAMDASSVIAAYTQARVGNRAVVHVADLAHPLQFAADSQFDVIVSPLVLHYLPTWEPTLREFHRVLRPGGHLVFSTHHPGSEAERLGTTAYFDTELVEETWEDVGQVRFYRRPLSAIFEALSATGFLTEQVVEPRPTDALRIAAPAAYERLLQRPAFLLVRARRESE